MAKVIFAGCSFTAGSGWNKLDCQAADKLSPFLWVNLCHSKIDSLRNLELINIGIPGGSNIEIFQSVITSISDHGSDIDTVFCQWTAMPRYNWNAGFELWNTSECISSNERVHDLNLNRGDSWSREYINDLINRLRVVHHLHWEILKLIEYTNTITKLTKKLNISNVFFINGLCPWDNNYFDKLDGAKPEQYTSFTKEQILNIDSRSDEDIYKLYFLAHQQYQQAGGILENYWINLYESFLSKKVDVNLDNIHPGKKSNQLYYQSVVNKLSN